MEQKEVERAEANAILASHYLKIKKYYPVKSYLYKIKFLFFYFFTKEGKFDKLMKNLYVDD